MATENNSARFRSATEFPKAVEHLNLTETQALYYEMRDCLIFTNRSRAQLIRRNEEHKQVTQQLKVDLVKLQGYIDRLKLEKTQITQSNQTLVAELEQEMQSMATHLDSLSNLFEGVADIDQAEQVHWSILSFPGRFVQFLQAIKGIVTWWRDERQSDNSAQISSSNTPQLPGTTVIEEDRRQNPQMYSDQASQGRSLLDR